MKFYILLVCLLIISTPNNFAGDNSNLGILKDDFQNNILRTDDENNNDDKNVQNFDDDTPQNHENLNLFLDSVFKKNLLTLEFLYGSVSPSYQENDFINNFSSPNIGELKFGFTTKEPITFKSNTFKTNNYFLSAGKISTNWQHRQVDAVSKISPDCYRLGIGFNHGYGWQILEKTDITLYNSGSIIWSQLNIIDSKYDKISNIFGDQFRFGESVEGGVRVQILQPVSFNASFERSIIFPRHMFWHWAGSKALKGLGDLVLNNYLKKVIKELPSIGPVVFFVLKSAYDYCIYELYKKNMNWPFDTTVPFMFDNFKIGVSVTF